VRKFSRGCHRRKLPRGITRNFQSKSPTDPTVFFGRPMMPETLSSWVRDPAARKRYVEAFARLDFEAMLTIRAR
jgi:hypothetical protein